jgi:Protein of unknown function (DUF4233)
MRSPRRTMCAAVLGFECVVLGLMTPVLITVESLSRNVGLSLGLGLAATALVIAALLRFEVGYVAGFALQIAAIAVGFLVPVMFVLGLIFGALWTTSYLLGKRIEREQAARLPG